MHMGWGIRVYGMNGYVVGDGVGDGVGDKGLWYEWVCGGRWGGRWGGG